MYRMCMILFKIPLLLNPGSRLFRQGICWLPHRDVLSIGFLSLKISLYPNSELWIYICDALMFGNLILHSFNLIFILDRRNLNISKIRDGSLKGESQTQVIHVMAVLMAVTDGWEVATLKSLLEKWFANMAGRARDKAK